MSLCGHTLSNDIVYEISQKMAIKWLNMWVFPTFLAFQVLVSALCLSLNKVFPLNQSACEVITNELTDEPHEGRLHGFGDVHPEGAERLRKHLRRPLKHRLHVRSDRATTAKRVVEILPNKKALVMEHHSETLV